MNGSEMPRPTWYEGLCGVTSNSPSKSGALIVGITGAGSGATQLAVFTAAMPARVPMLMPVSTETELPAATERSTSLPTGVPKLPSTVPRSSRPSTPRKRGAQCVESAVSMQVLEPESQLEPDMQAGMPAPPHASHDCAATCDITTFCSSGPTSWRTKSSTS